MSAGQLNLFDPLKPWNGMWMCPAPIPTKCCTGQGQKSLHQVLKRRRQRGVRHRRHKQRWVPCDYIFNSCICMKTHESIPYRSLFSEILLCKWPGFCVSKLEWGPEMRWSEDVPMFAHLPSDVMLALPSLFNCIPSSASSQENIYSLSCVTPAGHSAFV